MRSPKETYIIDAYNLMHFIPKFKISLYNNLESSREEFIHLLDSYFHNRKIDPYIVFDGEKNSSELNSLSTPRLKVIFSKSPEKADHRIKTLIDNFRNKALITVVSSDREVFQYAKVSRCKAMTSSEFYKKISYRPYDYENKIKSKSLSNDEVKYWKAIFENKT